MGTENKRREPTAMRDKKGIKNPCLRGPREWARRGGEPQKGRKTEKMGGEKGGKNRSKVKRVTKFSQELVEGGKGTGCERKKRNTLPKVAFLNRKKKKTGIRRRDKLSPEKVVGKIREGVRSKKGGGV